MHRAADARQGESDPPRLPASQSVACVAVAALLFVGHLAFGADRADAAVFVAALDALALASLLLTTGWAGAALAPLGRQWAPMAAFTAVLLIGIWSQTPFSPAAKVVWRYVGNSGAATLDRSATTVELIKLGGVASLFLVGGLIGASDARARRFLELIVLFSAIYAVWAFVQHVIDPRLIWGVPKSYHLGRLTGSFLSANIAGALFGMSLVLAVGLLLQNMRSIPTYHVRGIEQLLGRSGATLAAISFLAVCLVMTASRGAALFTCIALAILVGWDGLLHPSKRHKGAILIVAAVAGLLLPVIVLSAQTLIGRSHSLGSDWNDRQTLYTLHWHAFLAAPWTGYGLGSFQEVNRLFADPLTFSRVWNVRAAHNVYLQWLEQGGLIAALPMFACTGWLLVSVAVGAFRRRRMTTWLKAIVAASLILLLHGMTDFDLETPSLAGFWACLLGTGVGLAARSRTHATIEQPAPSGRLLSRLITGGVTTAALTTSLIAAVIFWELQPDLDPRPVPLPLSMAYGNQADAVLRLAPGALPPSIRERVRDLTWRQLRLSPVEPSAWLRLTYIDANGSPEAGQPWARWLQNSYDVAPFDAASFKWRVRFALENWTKLSPRLRQAMLNDVAAERTLHMDWLRQLVPQIGDTSGRLALILLLAADA